MPFRHAEGEDGEAAFEQAADDPFAFGHEDALPPVRQRAAQRGVGLQFRRSERVDLFDVRNQCRKTLCVWPIFAMPEVGDEIKKAKGLQQL